MAQAIEAYLEKHQLVAMVQKAMNTVIKQRATNPAAALAVEFTKAAKTAKDGDKPVVFFVLGGPGAGKGTQCAKIVEEFSYTHLSAGDLLREERSSGSEQGEMIEEYIKSGKIVPVEVTIKLLLSAIEKRGSKRILIDGFPRNTNNMSGWQTTVGDALNLAGVLCYDVSEEVLEERLLKRGETSGRSDDNIESIKKRFATFKMETLPVVEYFLHQGLCTKLDGSKSVDEVWAATKEFILSKEAALKKK